MVDRKDKSKPKAKGVDVSEYMPPGPVSSYPPTGQCMPGPLMPYPPMGPPLMPSWPDDYMKMDSLMAKLNKLKGQQVTVYVMGMGPIAPVSTITGGGAVVPASGAFGITGIVGNVGMDYVELRILTTGTERIVYIPFTSIAAVAPGGPLMMEVTPGTLTTTTGTAI